MQNNTPSSEEPDFILIAGPCVIESRDLLRRCAEALLEITAPHNLNFVFKASYRKANRSSVDSFTGVGDEQALGWLSDIRREFGLPVLSDFHSVAEVQDLSEAVDVIQIPAFLARQTDLLQAAGETGKTVNVKKAQFMAPTDMQKAAAKVRSAGEGPVWLTERGTSFGYHDLVVDFRGLIIMRGFGHPVIFDATHSVQRPSIGRESGGFREFIPHLARAAAACGIDGLFMEAHPDPANAKSDAATQLNFAEAGAVLNSVMALHKLAREFDGNQAAQK